MHIRQPLPCPTLAPLLVLTPWAPCCTPWGPLDHSLGAAHIAPSRRDHEELKPGAIAMPLVSQYLVLFYSILGKVVTLCSPSVLTAAMPLPPSLHCLAVCNTWFIKFHPHLHQVACGMLVPAFAMFAVHWSAGPGWEYQLPRISCGTAAPACSSLHCSQPLYNTWVGTSGPSAVPPSVTQVLQIYRPDF